MNRIIEGNKIETHKLVIEVDTQPYVIENPMKNVEWVIMKLQDD